jgi:hypothetical protein
MDISPLYFIWMQNFFIFFSNYFAEASECHRATIISLPLEIV